MSLLSEAALQRATGASERTGFFPLTRPADAQLKELQDLLSNEFVRRTMTGAIEDDPVVTLTVDLRLGRGALVPVTVDLIADMLTLEALERALQLSMDQRAKLVITGLRNVTTGQEVHFREDTELPFLHIEGADQWLAAPGAQFEVVYHDTRQATVDALTPDQLRMLRDEFDAIDRDHSGALTVDEIRAHFEKQQQADASLRKSSLQRSQFTRSAQLRMETAVEASLQLKRVQVEQQIAKMLELDLDGDGSIDFNEWLAGRASSVLENW